MNEKSTPSANRNSQDFSTRKMELTGYYCCFWNCYLFIGGSRKNIQDIEAKISEFLGSSRLAVDR